MLKTNGDIKNASPFCTVSLLNIFVGIGACLSSALSSHRLLGRRRTLALACSSIVAGMALLHLAPSHHLLLVGRALAGMGVGVAYPASFLFLHETALPTQRAGLASLNSGSLNTGAVLILTLGWIFPYELCPWLAAAPAITFVIFVWFIPESAVFLVQYQQEERYDVYYTVHSI